MDLSGASNSEPGVGRTVGIDFGTKRVGISIADPLGLFAQPYGTFTQDEAVEQLLKLQASEGIRVVVIGWPLTEDGEEGIATERVAQYIRRLQKRLKDALFVRMDERYTSEEARARLHGRTKSKKQIDALAAGIILQEYLDSAG